MRWHIGVLLAMIFGSVYTSYINPNMNIWFSLIFILIAFFICEKLEELEFLNRRKGK